MAEHRTFVLIHGAWHGGWCWDRVRSRLEAAGHSVHAPTLAGLADRSHMLSREITLATHAEEIVECFERYDINDAVLVGHSMGGFPVSLALETVQPRVSALVMLDAFWPADGQSPLDLLPPERKHEFMAEIAAGRLGRQPPPVSFFELRSVADRDWVEKRMTMQPYGTYPHPVRLSGKRDQVRTKVFVRAMRFRHPHLDAVHAALSHDPGWITKALDAGHEVMIERPDEVTGIMLAADGQIGSE